MERDYDVFLSFRGEVRANFACVLFDALKEIGHKPFMDKEDVRGGDRLTPKILKAIENCKSAIVIFSGDYTSSAWCLNELLLLLERRATTETFFIVPILYFLRAGDVKEGFCKKIDQNYEDKKYKDEVDDQQIEQWKKAVKEIGGTFAERFGESMMVTEFAKHIARRVQQLFDEKRTLLRLSKPLDTSKRPSREEPLVVNPAPKGLEPFTLPSTILQHNQPMPTISTGNTRMVQTNNPSLNHVKESLRLPQVPFPEGKLDQVASSSQLQSPQIQRVPTSPDRLIESTTSAKPVLYTSSGGVWSTVKGCRAVKNILEEHEVEFEERDAWTDDKFTTELKQLMDTLSYPRLFVGGRDIGGLREVEELRDNGELGAIVKPYKRQQGNPGQTSPPISEIKEEKKACLSFTYRCYSPTPCCPAERTLYSKSKRKGGYL